MTKTNFNSGNNMIKSNGFNPAEVIFSLTDACNLHCPHCFVPREKRNLNANDAISFLRNVSKYKAPDGLPYINKVGFSGGEPFLRLDFLCSVIKETIDLNMNFDRIMTNAIWWNSEEQLKMTLNELYDTGYDGKIGISFDNFHAQPAEKIARFCSIATEIWQDPELLVIQSVINPAISIEKDMQCLNKLAEILCADIQTELKEDGTGEMALENDDMFIYVYRFLPSLQSESPEAWKSSVWFKEDYCQGPGNIFYIHPDGNIAPCCGFSNENKQLYIGNIHSDFTEIMKNASENPMVKLCFEKGLSSILKERQHNFPGKTADICTFCDFICKSFQ